MRKENQEMFSKNLWVLYAPDVTAAQGAAGSAVRTVVTQQKANCRAE